MDKFMEEFEKALQFLIELAYETGYISAQIEGGKDTPSEYQMRKIASRNRLKKTVVLMVSTALDQLEARNDLSTD